MLNRDDCMGRFDCMCIFILQIYDKTGEDVIGSINKKWEGERDDNLNVDHEYFEIHCKLFYF